MGPSDPLKGWLALGCWFGRWGHDTSRLHYCHLPRTHHGYRGYIEQRCFRHGSNCTTRYHFFHLTTYDEHIMNPMNSSMLRLTKKAQRPKIPNKPTKQTNATNQTNQTRPKKTQNEPPKPPNLPMSELLTEETKRSLRKVWSSGSRVLSPGVQSSIEAGGDGGNGTFV